MSELNSPGNSQRRPRERGQEDHELVENGQPRKRARYIAKACNECKRRKIKCNGQKPCRRCGNHSVECIYSPSATSGEKQNQDVQRLYDQISSLQDQIKMLSSTVATLGSQATGASVPPVMGLEPQSLENVAQEDSFPTRRRTSPRRKTPLRGPTTSAFSFDVAKSSLRNQGITQLEEPVLEANSVDPSPMPSPPLSPNRSFANQRDPDPIWAISKDEACRLCLVYEEEMGAMYPFLSLDWTLSKVEQVYSNIYSSTSSTGQIRMSNQGSDDAEILKMVFACALTAQSGGRSEIALSLFTDVRKNVFRYMWGPPEIGGVLLLLLVAICYFQMDEEALAWRILGIVARMCLEMGLNRRETFQEPEIVAFGTQRAVKLFWSVYVLDMRWSLGTGMPFTLQDTDIDPKLPQLDEREPYLRVMIDYSRIAAKVYKFVTHFNNTNEVNKDEMGYLDWQVLKWQKSIPDALRIPDHETEQQRGFQSRSMKRLQYLVYLRANQMRILIHRPILHSAAHMARNIQETDIAVDVAKDTVRFITHLNETSDIYRLQQVTFNWFLVSALAVLFLAVAQNSARYGGQCKEEFYMVLELVKYFSTRSYISRRLWRSIKSLKKLAPKLGLGKDRDVVTEANAFQHEPSVDNTFSIDPQGAGQGQHMYGEVPPDGTQMSRDLMLWFETFGAMADTDPLLQGDVPNVNSAGAWQSDAFCSSGYEFLGSNEGLSSIMKDCF